MPTIQRPTRLCAGFFTGFVVISVLVVFEIAILWDDRILVWVGTQRQPWLTNVMVFFTVMGDGAIEVPLVLGIILLLWRMGRPICARRLFLAALLGELLYLFAKWAFARPRPRIITHMASAGWYSYPSGHSMLAPVIWSLSFLLLARSVSFRPARFVLHLLAVILPIGIAVSRVYLGVHYPSDVVAGLLLGTAWMLLWSALPLPASSRNCAAASAPAT